MKVLELRNAGVFESLKRSGRDSKITEQPATIKCDLPQLKYHF
jgi:hypothetical protein